VRFFRYGYAGVAIQGRRGGSPWFDARPLLVAAQPEVCEYRMQYYEGHAHSGDFTAVQSITVVP